MCMFNLKSRGEKQVYYLQKQLFWVHVSMCPHLCAHLRVSHLHASDGQAGYSTNCLLVFLTSHLLLEWEIRMLSRKIGLKQRFDLSPGV